MFRPAGGCVNAHLSTVRRDSKGCTARTFDSADDRVLETPGFRRRDRLHARPRWAHSSAVQSGRLITGETLVRIQVGP